jgi:hypothetical protein
MPTGLVLNQNLIKLPVLLLGTGQKLQWNNAAASTNEKRGENISYPGFPALIYTSIPITAACEKCCMT